MLVLSRTVRILLLLALTQTAVCLGANKEIVQLQRDVALLHNDVRALKRSLNQSLGGSKALVEQTLERMNQIHAADVVRNQEIAKNWERLSIAIATLSTRLNQSASEYLATRESVADLSARLARLEQRLEDIQNLVTRLRVSPNTPAVSDAREGPPAGMSAEKLFQSALRDKLAGHFDLALEEFGHYLRHYGDTELAASSQFYIGEIHYHRGNLLRAEDALSRVVERYPQDRKAADALLMRALVREKQGKLTAAKNDLNRLLATYRGSNAARRAATELKRLGRENLTAKPRSS